MDLGRSAEHVRDGAGLGVLLPGLAVGRAAADAVSQGQVAARRQAVQQPADDGPRFGVVADVAQHSDQEHGGGLGQVQRAGGGGEDGAGLAHIRVDIGAGALLGAGEQAAGVGQHERVVVCVHDPAVRRGPLGDLVGVVRGGQARADVEELADAGLGGQEADRAGHELPRG